MWKKLHTMGLNIFWHTAYLAVSLLFTTAVDDVLSLKNLFVTNMSHSESYLKQLSKFGFNQTPDRPLIDSWSTPNVLQDFFGDDSRFQFGELSQSALQLWLQSDSWLPTDFGQTQIKPNSIYLLDITPGLNLESCSNQLSKFGELLKSALQIWFQSDSWQTLDRLLIDS